jgi:hypothetical protein
VVLAAHVQTPPATRWRAFRRPVMVPSKGSAPFRVRRRPERLLTVTVAQ